MSWAKAKLGKICKIEKGSTGINKAIPGVYPMVVTSEARKSHNEYQFDDDAVIIPLVSSTGHGHKSLKRIHFQQGKFALGSILCAVIPKDKTLLNAAYLYRYLDLHKDDELVARMKGMANVTLPIKEIAQIEIPLPPIKEQIEFTKKYYRLESNSESLSAQFASQLDLLKKLRQQILQDAVQGKLAPQDPNDEPASVLLQKIKAEKEQLIREKKIRQEKPLPAIKPEDIPFEIPENWVWCRLEEVGIVNPRNHLPDDTEVSFIPMNLISANYGTYPEYLLKKWKEIKNGFTHFADDDIAIAKITPCFENSKACIFKNLKNGVGAGTTELYVFRPNPKNISPEYIYINLKTQRFLNNGERIMRGVAGQQRVPSEYFRELIIPLPPLNDQHRIVTKVAQLMSLCDDLEQTMKQNQAYTRQLLQVALKEALEPGS